MKKGWRRVITTAELLSFARRHHVPLGRTNPERTLTYYQRLGLLPPRIRLPGQPPQWGFPGHAAALLLRIRDLRRDGLTLAQIQRGLEEEALPRFRAERAIKERSPGLGALPFDAPDFDYNHQFYEISAKAALQAINRGNTDQAKAILREIIAIGEAVEKGRRTLITIGGAVDSGEQGQEGGGKASAPDRAR